MKVRITWGSSRSLTKPGVLAWVQYSCLLVSALTLGFCALVYLQTILFQKSQSRLFRSASLDAAPPTVPLRSLPVPALGTPISTVEIPRLGISVVVVEGVGPEDLKLGVGHIPGTALPGEAGNIGLAGHRDTFFRKLEKIHSRDSITLTTLRGSLSYSVESTQIVDPTDLQVLQSSNEPILTLVTCYPFSYVGPAPKRFIVRARYDPSLPVVALNQ